jgi:hypothetical protein
MKHRTDDIDDASLDRLVDGELDSDQRRQLLESLESQPDGWRRCAMAFLESQAWRREMRQLVSGSEVNSVNAAEPVSCRKTPNTSESLRGWRLDRNNSGLWLAAAAALLVAFGAGRQFGAGERADLRDAQIASQAPSPRTENAEPRPVGDAVTLVVNDHRGVPQRVQVPLVEGRNLGEQFAETPQWSSSPELVRRLNEQGLGLAARRRYAPLFFEQQNRMIPMIVPVDDAVVTPVSRPVY